MTEGKEQIAKPIPYTVTATPQSPSAEVEVLKEGLKKKFGITSAIHKGGKGFSLYIGARGGQADRFCAFVKPVVSSRIPSMLYKFH